MLPGEWASAQQITPQYHNDGQQYTGKTYKSAELFIRNYFIPGNGRGLGFHNSEFWEYNNAVWATAPKIQGLIFFTYRVLTVLVTGRAYTTSCCCRYIPGGQSYFCLKAAVKCSTLLKPEEKAMSATGWAVLRNNNSAFLSRMVSKN